MISSSLPTIPPADPSSKVEGPCVCAIPIASHRKRVPELAACVLDSAEQERAAAFRSDADRARFVLGRAAVRIVCATHRDIPPRAVRFRTGPVGKPTGSDPGDPEFNVSHSGNWVLVAWHTAGPVGVDVEKVREARTVGYADLAGRMFTQEECAWIAAGGPEEQAARFMRVWVRKEAVVKAAGTGIAGNFSGFGVLRLVDGDPGWFVSVRLPGDDLPWRVGGLALDATHSAAVAWRHGAEPVRVEPSALGW